MTTSTGNVLPVDTFLEQEFGYHHNFIGWACLVLCGFWLTFWGSTALALKYLNWNKR